MRVKPYLITQQPNRVAAILETVISAYSDKTVEDYRREYGFSKPKEEKRENI